MLKIRKTDYFDLCFFPTVYNNYKANATWFYIRYVILYQIWDREIYVSLRWPESRTRSHVPSTWIQSKRLPLLQVVSNNKSFSVGVLFYIWNRKKKDFILLIIIIKIFLDARSRKYPLMVEWPVLTGTAPWATGAVFSAARQVPVTFQPISAKT